VGYVYLLCFDGTHYVGFARNREHLKERISLHRAGEGAKYTTYQKSLGCEFEVVRLWKNATPADEQRVKSLVGKHFCPKCSPYLNNAKLRKELPKAA
jgi:predicted GIY-YIG superfamily endonuclease